jgi:hypothetical protein
MILAICISNLSFGQIEEKMKKEGVVKGVILKDGGKIEGFIKKLGSTYWESTYYDAPWEFQATIKFIPKDVFENNEKIKNKYFEKYEAKDCDGYIYDTLIFESVKYADMSAVGAGMIAKKMFMKRTLDDKISLFEFYQVPPSIVTGDYVNILIENAKPSLVYRVGEKGKLKLVNDMNVKKELANCSYVIEKYERGEYKIVGKEGEGSGGNKLLNNTMFREQVRLMIIEDYNNNCK